MAQILPHEQGNSHQDIESGGVHDPWPSGIQGNPSHLNIPQPSSEMIISIIGMEWMIIAFLLSINLPINGEDGNNVLTILFHHHPMSFNFIVMIGVVAFYFTWRWMMMMIAGRFQTRMARILILVVLVLGVLAITVILNALIPKFRWIVWIFFGLTIWVMLDMQGCEWATQLTVRIGKPVEEGCKWATRWTMDKIRTLYGDRFCCLPDADFRPKPFAGSSCAGMLGRSDHDVSNKSTIVHLFWELISGHVDKNEVYPKLKWAEGEETV